MGARSRAALGGVLAVCVAAILGCGGSDSAPAPSTVSEAELQLGANLLSPDEGVASAGALNVGDTPPDTTTAASVDDEDLPPAS